MIKFSPVRDILIRDATSGIDLLKRAEKVDPDLAKQLIGKPLVASRSPPVVAVSAVLMWLSSKYVLGLDQETADLLVLIVATAAGYGIRFFTRVPITTIVAKPVVQPASPEGRANDQATRI